MDKFLVCAILTIFVFVRDAGATKCYVCNSKQDSSCLNPMDEASRLELTDCNADKSQRIETRKAIENISNMLQRLGSPSIQLPPQKNPVQIWENENYPMACQKLEIEVNGDLIVGRGCTAPRMDSFDPCEAVKLITDKGFVLQSCSICDTDGCNSAVTAVGSVSLGFACAILLLILTT